MHETPSADLALTQELLDEAFARLVAGEALDPFCTWFVARLDRAAIPQPLSAAEADWSRRGRLAVARWFWAHLPVPGNQWRARGLPVPERNRPCYCGSGRKYKHCCQEFASQHPPLDHEALLTLALEHADPAALAPERMCKLSAHALALTAQAWNDNGEPERTVALLEPLFLQYLDRLGADHEMALDALATALLELGQDRRRQVVLEYVSQSQVLALATTARARLVALRSDQGDDAGAWALFHEARRLSPDDPQLWSLELTLLLGQGRNEEARLRAPLLAARARSKGLPELAGMLLKLANQGLSMGRDSSGDAELLATPTAQAWLALGAAVPADTSPSAWRAAYDATPRDAPADETAGPKAQGIPLCILAPLAPLRALERRWHRRWRVAKPDLTWLTIEDDGALLDESEQVLAFLRKNPQAWLSFDILDDLVLAGAELTFHNVPDALLAASQRLIDHALAGLRALLGSDPAQLPWGCRENRPALRLLAQGIELAHARGKSEAWESLLTWGLTLNPVDNHGWRHDRVEALLQQARFEQALQLLARYPDDAPPSEHSRALALFATGHRHDAAAVLRAAHAAHPLFMAALWPDVMDAPEPDDDAPGILMGGAEAAYDYRVATRAAWVSQGALAWARELHLPTPAPARPKTHGSVPTPRRRAPPFGAARARRLGQYGDYARMQGFLTAVVWSPQPPAPDQWLHAALALLAPPEDAPGMQLHPAQLQEAADLLVQLYQRLNFDVLHTAAEAPPPLALLRQLPVAEPGIVARWAAGFVEGAELARNSWRAARCPIEAGRGAFDALLELAAPAAPSPSGWRVTGRPDQPLLVGLEPGAGDLHAALLRAMQALWRISAPLRHAALPR